MVEGDPGEVTDGGAEGGDRQRQGEGHLHAGAAAQGEGGTQGAAQGDLGHTGVGADTHQTHAQQLELGAEHHAGHRVPVDEAYQGAHDQGPLDHGHAEDTVIDLTKTGNQSDQECF